MNFASVRIITDDVACGTATAHAPAGPAEDSDLSVSVILALGFGGWTSPEPLLHDRTHRPQHLDSQPVDCQRPVFGSCFDQVRDLETLAQVC